MPAFRRVVHELHFSQLMETATYANQTLESDRLSVDAPRIPYPGQLDVVAVGILHHETGLRVGRKSSPTSMWATGTRRVSLNSLIIDSDRLDYWLLVVRRTWLCFENRCTMLLNAAKSHTDSTQFPPNRWPTFL